MSELEVIEGDLQLQEIHSAETVAETSDGEILRLGDAKVSVGTDAAKHIRALFNTGEYTPQAVPNRLSRRLSADGETIYYDRENDETLSVEEARSRAEFSAEDTVAAINDSTQVEIEYGGETTETEQYAETIQDIGDEVQIDDGILGDLRRLGPNALDADRAFTTNAPGNTAGEYSVSLYESGERSDLQGSIMFEDAEDVEPFLSALSNLPEGVDPSAALEGSDAIEAATGRSRQRRRILEAGREAAEAAGVDLDEFDVGATAEGEVILQDEDTGRTRTIDADTSGGLGAALDAETSGGEFVADDADPAAGSASGRGLGARAVAAVVLLLGAIAAAVGWSG